MSMDAPSNLFEGFLRVKEQGLEFDKGDSVIVSLGYDEDTQDRRVQRIEYDTLSSKFSRVSVYALSSMSNLCNLHIDRFYEQQTAGAVIKDLALTVGVDLDEVADGIHLP